MNKKTIFALILLSTFCANHGMDKSKKTKETQQSWRNITSPFPTIVFGATLLSIGCTYNLPICIYFGFGILVCEMDPSKKRLLKQKQ